MTGNMTPGDYSIGWNGMDDHGAAVAAGSYVFRLETDDGQQTSKAVILR